jgi:hypothetical protein
MMTMDQLRTIKQDTPKACLRNGVHINIIIEAYGFELQEGKIVKLSSDHIS